MKKQNPKISVYIPSYYPDDKNYIQERRNNNIKLVEQFSEIDYITIYIFSQNYKEEDYLEYKNVKYVDIESIDVTYARRKIRDHIINKGTDEYVFLLDDDIYFNEEFLNRIDGLKKLIDRLVNVSNKEKIGLISLINNDILHKKDYFSHHFANVNNTVDYTDNSLTEISIIPCLDLKLTSGTLFINLKYYPYEFMEFRYCNNEILYAGFVYQNEIKAYCLDKTILNSGQKRLTVLNTFFYIDIDHLYSYVKNLIDFENFKELFNNGRTKILEYLNDRYDELNLKFIITRFDHTILFLYLPYQKLISQSDNYKKFIEKLPKKIKILNLKTDDNEKR